MSLDITQCPLGGKMGPVENWLSVNVRVSCGCRNNLPQTEGLKQQKFALKALTARGLNEGIGRASLHPNVLGG